MSDRDELIDTAVDRIAEGEPVDWAALAAVSSSVEWHARLDDLRILAGVSRLALRARDHDDTPAPATWHGLLLVEPIGRGRYGQVHRAWDPRLRREVAVKLVSGDGPAGERALHEGRLLARVRHPNVAVAYGVESAGGRVGIIMELVKGRSLAALFAGDEPMGRAAAMAIGQQVGEALAAVHAAGLVHRDITAANVVIESSGRAVLTDFGAGLSHEDAGTDGPVGTPLYLAPEILAGAAPSSSSDVYSAGVLLHRLLTGAHPVEATNLTALRVAHRRGRDPRVLDAACLPPDVHEVLEAALDPTPERRPSAAALAARLAASRQRHAGRAVPRRWHSLAPWAPGLAAAVAALVLPLTRPAPPADATASLILLPFENRTGDTQLDGVLEAMLDRALSASPGPALASPARLADALAVLRRPSDTPLTLPLALEIASHDRAIGAVLGGRVERSGNGFVATANLIDAASGRTIMSAAAGAGQLAGLASASRSLAARLRPALGGVAAGPGPSPSEPITTASVRALRLYSQSYRLATETSERTWPAALELVREALRLDPELAVAHTWLAWCMYRTGAPSMDYLAAADAAQRLREHAAPWERHWIDGSRALLGGDVAVAVHEYEQLVRFYPTHYWAVWNLYTGYLRLGRTRDAAAVAVRWAAMRPLDLNAQYRAVNAMGRQGELADSLAYARRGLTLSAAESPVGADLQSWVLLLPALERFAARDPEGVRRQLAEVMAPSGPIGRDAVARQSAALLLAIGRRGDAATAAQSIGDERLRSFVLADVAYSTGDSAAIRASVGTALRHALAASELPWWTPWLVALQIRSGATAKDDAVADYTGREPGNRPTARWLAGEAALAAGRWPEAVAALREARQQFVRGNWNWFLSSEALGHALDGAGRSAEALEVFAEVIAAGAGETTGQANGRFWMPAQFAAARLARAGGDPATADRFDAELRRILQFADRGFSLERHFGPAARAAASESAGVE